MLRIRLNFIILFSNRLGFSQCLLLLEKVHYASSTKLNNKFGNNPKDGNTHQTVFFFSDFFLKSKVSQKVFLHSLHISISFVQAESELFKLTAGCKFKINCCLPICCSKIVTNGETIANKWLWMLIFIFVICYWDFVFVNVWWKLFQYHYDWLQTRLKKWIDNIVE